MTEIASHDPQQRSDPYFLARDNAQSRILEAARQLELWGGILLCARHDDASVTTQVRELRRELRSINKTIDGLASTVKLVATQAATLRAGDRGKGVGAGAGSVKFRHIDAAELEDRREFVRRSRTDVERLEANIAAQLKEQARRNANGRESGGLAVGQLDGIAPFDPREKERKRRKKKKKKKKEKGGKDHDARAQLQKRLADEEAEQDLEQLLAAVTHMGDAAKEIGNELADHNYILNQMDSDATYAQLAVGKLNRGIHQILTTQSNAPVYVIIALTLTLVVLIVLIIML